MTQHAWLNLSRSDIETERRQCEQEGRDLSAVQADFERVQNLDLALPEKQAEAQALLDRTIALPLRAGYAFVEPSDLEEILQARPADAPALPGLRLSGADLEDRIHGAWTGRCVGCLLGKPVEGWRRDRMWGLLKDLNRWPLQDYFRYDSITPELKAKYDLSDARRHAFADQVDCMPEDDDTNYTVTGMALLSRHGAGFVPADVADFWLSELPILHTCTAERVAYRNLALLIGPPASASFRNPYREWIGAQIRADFWGYAAPGNPELAAELAWRDASISHVKNGIYGAMWCAAMTAAAFVTDDIPTIIRAGLAQIPANCRLADAVESVLEWHEIEIDYDTAVYRVHELWNETTAHDWCHVISNAMIVAIGLLWSERDFGKGICGAVQACFDTDCNGATVGSILGAIQGRKALPDRWAGAIQDTLRTGLSGYPRITLTELTRETLAIIGRMDGAPTPR